MAVFNCSTFATIVLASFAMDSVSALRIGADQDDKFSAGPQVEVRDSSSATQAPRLQVEPGLPERSNEASSKQGRFAAGGVAASLLTPAERDAAVRAAAGLERDLEKLRQPLREVRSDDLTNLKDILKLAPAHKISFKGGDGDGDMPGTLKPLAEYQINISMSRASPIAVETTRPMNINKWFRLARLIHEKTVAKAGYGGIKFFGIGSRKVDAAFNGESLAGAIDALEVSYKTLTDNKKTYFQSSWSPKAASDLKTWLTAFKKVAGNDDQMWGIFIECFQEALVYQKQ